MSVVVPDEILYSIYGIREFEADLKVLRETRQS